MCLCVPCVRQFTPWLCIWSHGDCGQQRLPCVCAWVSHWGLNKSILQQMIPSQVLCDPSTHYPKVTQSSDGFTAYVWAKLLFFKQVDKVEGPGFLINDLSCTDQMTIILKGRLPWDCLINSFFGWVFWGSLGSEVNSIAALMPRHVVWSGLCLPCYLQRYLTQFMRFHVEQQDASRLWDAPECCADE